jgi:hypothetical protein
MTRLPLVVLRHARHGIWVLSLTVCEGTLRGLAGYQHLGSRSGD